MIVLTMQGNTFDSVIFPSVEACRAVRNVHAAPPQITVGLDQIVGYPEAPTIPVAMELADASKARSAARRPIA
jgi:hypothetical protein